MTQRLHLFAAAFLTLTFAVPASGWAQRHGGHGYQQANGPTHFVSNRQHDRPQHVDAHHGYSDQRLRRAYGVMEAFVEQADSAAAPYDEPRADQQISHAYSALASARHELGGHGSEARFYAYLDDAEQHANAAVSRVRQLEAELDGLRDEATYALRDAWNMVGHRSYSQVNRSLASAEASIDAGERSLRRHDYTSARREFASALASIEDACAQHERLHARERRYVQTPTRARPVGYDGRGRDGCPSTRGGRWAY